MSSTIDNNPSLSRPAIVEQNSILSAVTLVESKVASSSNSPLTPTPEQHVNSALQLNSSPTTTSSLPHTVTPEQYENLASQFGIYVLISTFSVGLIIAFMSFAHDIIFDSDLPPILHFEVGLLLAFIATGIHIGVIVIAGRAAALCMRLANINRCSPGRVEAQASSQAKNEVDDGTITELRGVDFVRYITYCERLQLVGTIILLGSFLFLSFSLFTSSVFPWVLVAASLVGGYLVFRIGYWKVSVLRSDVVAIRRKIMRKGRGGC